MTAHLQAEQAVLAATLISPPVVDRLTLDYALTPAEFDHPAHRTIYTAILELHSRGARVDTIALAAAAPAHAALIQDLPAFTPGIANIGEHAAIVKRAALRRSWHAAATRLIEAADTDNEALVAQAEALLAAPSGTDETWTPDRLGEDACDFLSETGTVGIPTGFPRLDTLLAGGLRPGDMTVIGAWTSQGKSAWASTVLQHAAVNGYRCHEYINEMSARDRTIRTLARMTGADYGDLVQRQVDPAYAPLVLDAAQRLPFGITECAQWSVEQICRHVRANKWDLWCLDILHNIAYEREAELHHIVVELAAAARSSQSHALVCVHFNEARAVGETLPVPVARDIRGSGMVKNVASNVLLLHREQTNQGGFVTTSRDGIVKVEKSRHGQLGMVPVRFEPQSMRFDQASLHAVGDGRDSDDQKEKP